MEGSSVELQATKSEPKSETLDHTCDNNVVLCEDRDVKQEPVDDASFSDLTDPGGDTTASPLEAVKSEENQHPPSRLVELMGGDLGTAHSVKDESDIYDPCLEQDSLDSPPETAQTSSPNHKSLVDIIIPTDCVKVKPQSDHLTPAGSQRTSSERSPQGPPSGEVFQAHRPGTSVHKKSPSAKGRDRDSHTHRKRRRIAETERKHDDAAQAKLELIKMQTAIARNRLKRLKNGTSIEEAEANLRRTEHEIKLQTLKSRYEREVEKEKLRAKISKIDIEIQKCILMKKRPQRDCDDR